MKISATSKRLVSTGRDSGACIGLAEDQAAAGPEPTPRVTISSSP